jgi:uncharacterized protein
MTYIKREIAASINAALQDMPVVVLTGMRQTGKSTFLQKESELKDRKYITLDDFAQLTAARENPDVFIGSGEKMIIDEAQRCPELFLAIKKYVDKKRVPGQFILSGSANFLLMKNLGDSLAGRAVYFNLYPFSRRELNKTAETTPFLKTFFDEKKITGSKKIMPIANDEVIKGGFPTVVLQNLANPQIWFKGYEQTYLERDIRDLSRTANVLSFRNLLHLAAFRTGNILSISEIGRDAKLSSATVRSYLSLLELSCLIHCIPPYLGNKASRLIKSPKFYISDSGLAGFLAEVGDISTSSLRGAIFETYAAQNLISIINCRMPSAKLSFWNIQGRHEIDFIIEQGNKCIAVEVKAAGRWNSSDLTALKSFVASTPGCVAAILAYNGTEAVQLGEKLWALPLSLVLS